MTTPQPFDRAGLPAMLALVGLCLTLAGPGWTDDWPQWRGPRRDGVWREDGIVDRFTGPELELRWRVPISSGYSAPTVAGGRVYTMDRIVRPEQMERVHCVDARTGALEWSRWYRCPYVDVSYDAGPRAAVTVAQGRAYSLGTMGHLFCFDAASGDVLWRHDLYESYSIRMPEWGIAASPLVHGDLVIVQIGGAGDACLVAFDTVTGAERWRALPDPASYSSPIIIDQAGQPVLIAWTGERVVGLDPGTGSAHWAEDFPSVKFVRNTASPVVEGRWLFLSAFFQGSFMLRLDPDRLAVEPLWRRQGESEKKSKALHTNISTCFVVDDHVYGVDAYGQLRCLDAATGERVWESLEATPNIRWSNIFFVRNGDVWWLFNELGELIRARLTPAGYEELDRARLIAPSRRMLPSRRGGVVWSHPAFANRCVFARSDEELVCASLAKE